MKQTTRARNKEFFWKIVEPRCRRCNYDECISALQLHHIDASQKEKLNDSLGRWLSLSRYKLVKKLAGTKFSIFCSNCHTKLHVTLKERDVRINPIDVTVFKEMLNCMRRSKRLMHDELDSAIDNENEDAIDELYAKVGKIYETRKYRIENGIDCRKRECGFCGIEDIITRPGGENE